MPLSAAPPLIYSLPLPNRPPPSVLDYIQVTLFNAVFMLGILGCHAFQLLSLPLHLTTATLPYFNKLGRVSQGLFARLLVLIAMIWAPTVIRITVDEDDDELDLRKIVQRNEQGVAVGLDLPERMVMMSNHQVYCDWSYIWNLLYFANLDSNLIIMLKGSLKWVPVVGPAMQMFRFIFMQRNWAADRVNLGKQLVKLGNRASRSFDPFVLLVFPEGTLVSPLTRPASEKYAAKTKIPDCQYLLLPRSTGLLFCLRTLSPRVNTLRLLDVTIGYPGIPRGGYGQDYYTLQSIFGRGTPPPVIHMHLRSDSVRHNVPIGKGSLSSSHTTGAEATEEEKKDFDAWLLKRWREKDERLEKFMDEGRMNQGKFVDIPVQFRSTGDLVALLAATIFGLWVIKLVLTTAWRVVVG